MGPRVVWDVHSVNRKAPLRSSEAILSVAVGPRFATGRDYFRHKVLVIRATPETVGYAALTVIEQDRPTKGWSGLRDNSPDSRRNT